MANIYEVAKRAGVSTATVSRVMSGQKNVVSAATRRRVLRAVEQLGYTPNAAAKNLRTLKTRKLLVTVPDIANPFFALILQGIEDAAQREGYAVLLGDTQHDPMREDRYAQMLRRKEADGLIFLGHRLPPAAEQFVRRRRRPSARPSSTAASSARSWACRACTSTTRRRRTKRWTISIRWATGGLASSRGRSSARSAAIGSGA